jgi:hypothetical protein
VIDRRRRDHERIDRILASRVAAEDGELGGPRKPLDRLLTPLNRASSRQFLWEARQKVWRNTFELQQARVAGPDVYRARLAELELLTAAKIADLIAPGQVLLRLAARGFGVTLPPPEGTYFHNAPPRRKRTFTLAPVGLRRLLPMHSASKVGKRSFPDPRQCGCKQAEPLVPIVGSPRSALGSTGHDRVEPRRHRHQTTRED